MMRKPPTAMAVPSNSKQKPIVYGFRAVDNFWKQKKS